MANYGSNQTTPILVDGFDVGGTGGPMNTMSDEVQAPLEMNMGFGAAWQTFANIGVFKWMFALAGFFDDTANSVSDAFSNTKNGLLRICCYSYEGGTIGKHFIGLQGAGENSFKRLPAVTALTKAQIGFQGSGNLDQGQITHAFATESSATGNTQATPADNLSDTSTQVQIPVSAISNANPTHVTSTVPHGLVSGDVVYFVGTNSTPVLDGGTQGGLVVTVIDATHFTVPVNVTVAGTAAGYFTRVNSDNGGAAYLQVNALTLGGYTNFAPLAVHSSDNVSYTTLATFATVTTAPSAQRVVVAAGTLVKRYTAVSWTYNGAGSGQSVKFFSGFARA